MGDLVNNKMAGMLLMGFAFLTGAIVYSFMQLSSTIYHIGGFISGAGGTKYMTGETFVPWVSIVLIIVALFVGGFLFNEKE